MSRIERLAPMVAVLFVTGLAVAQGPREPSVNSPAPAWLGYAVMFLIGAGVLGVALYPVKRSHMD
ncbi:MAG: hypothetical protein KGR22_05305 [Planctomycetes bacterium]|nr:hypothetical protein [Planctomycetota bacterium]